jgi:hypothetical protein
LDEAMKTLIPCNLDINVVSWEDLHPDSIEKLRLTLKFFFEYVDNKLSTMGFINVMKRWLKMEINKLKTRFLEGRTKCPINIEPTHWERLKVYWNKPEIEKKAEQMSNVRSKAKNLTNFGRMGRAWKEA